MLTPFFEISQTENEIIILIHAPYANIKDTEIYAEENDFRFYSSPYYLRLHFPGNVKDIDEPCVRYLVDDKQFEVTLQKCVPGEHFPDLDLIGRLLAPKKRNNIKPDIQVINSTDNGENENPVDDINPSDEDSEDEWLIDQQVVEPNLHACSLNGPRYGFANQTSNAFCRLGEEFYEVVNLRDIDVTSESERVTLMKEEEQGLFSDDHYLSDLMEPEYILPLIDYCPPWRKPDDTVKLSKTELEVLKNFGNKEYLLTKDDERSALLSLFDIVFATIYDFRTTMSDSSVESAWTINKLSATLSWLLIFKTPEEVVSSCLRRSLIYPLYRHWDLSNTVLQDTVIIFKAGKRHLLWLLLRIHSLFNESEPRYMLNELYIKDYCIWLQHVSDKKLTKLADKIEQISLKKEDIDLDIDILEAAANSLVDEEEESVLARGVDKISIQNREQNQSESETTESEDDESDSDDSSVSNSASVTEDKT